MLHNLTCSFFKQSLNRAPKSRDLETGSSGNSLALVTNNFDLLSHGTHVGTEYCLKGPVSVKIWLCRHVLGSENWLNVYRSEHNRCVYSIIMLKCEIYLRKWGKQCCQKVHCFQSESQVMPVMDNSQHATASICTIQVGTLAYNTSRI